MGPNIGNGLGVQSATSICESLQQQGCPGNSQTCGGAAPTQSTQTAFIVGAPDNGADENGALGRGGMVALVGIVAWFVAAW